MIANMLKQAIYTLPSQSRLVHAVTALQIVSSKMTFLFYFRNSTSEPKRLVL